MHFWKAVLLLAVVVALMPVSGCGSDEVDLVLITGTVRNIDTAEVASGVRVTLLDTSYRTDVATDDQGSFSIKVPKGSVLYLHTDDFDSARDDWIPLINIETPSLVADGPMENLLIHACPVSTGQAAGSEAIWDNYLSLEDDANGDRFVPQASRASGGIITLLAVGCDGLSFVNMDSLEVNFNHAMFPTSYFNGNDLFASGLSAGVTPRAYAVDHLTDESAWVMSFGDPAYTGGDIVASVRDRKSSRGLVFGPTEIPVRPGTISLVWVVVLDDVTGKSLQDLLPCLAANP